MKKLIFLSHIHEENELAIIVQKAIEEEFGGFVKVFVSSDGSSISAGANFLTRIEEALCESVAGIYLISPNSVKRNWINFELGSIWIRNKLNMKNGQKEIPTIPFCHSGSSPGSLPMPLTNLNGINASNKNDLIRVFKNIQTAVGGSGRLKTDFDILKQSIDEFVKFYTIGSKLLDVFQTMKASRQQIESTTHHCKKIGRGEIIDLDLKDVPQSMVDTINEIINHNFKNKILISQEGQSTGFNDIATQMAIGVLIKIKTDYILDFEEILINNLE